jgi:hypothetical protein
MADFEPDKSLPPLVEEKSAGGGSEPAARKRWGWLRKSARGAGWLLASPTEWFGLRSIRAGASSIGRLYEDTRARTGRDRRFAVEENRLFDKAATAFNYGITIDELERRLAARRRQTALLAYGLFAIGCLFVLGWLWVAVRTASDGGRVLVLMRFLPFCALFYLMSFYNALINFQIRTGRGANWLEYISTEKDFLPR